MENALCSAFYNFILLMWRTRYARDMHMLYNIIRKPRNALNFYLTLLWWRSLSYRNQSIDLESKSMDWFLPDRDLLHERVHHFLELVLLLKKNFLKRKINKSSKIILKTINERVILCNLNVIFKLDYFRELFMNSRGLTRGSKNI